LLAAGLVLAPTAAHATDQPTYVLAAWSIGNPDSIWETPQELETYVMLDAPTLDALDTALPCGGYFQIDLYWADQDSAALIAGGLLYGPQNPKEPHAYVVDGDPWKFVTTADCVVKPVVRPFHDERQEVTCDTVTTFTRDGFFDLDFDPVGNVWSERVEPTITGEGSSVAPNTAPDASCNPAGVQLPTLAETGAADGLFWLLGASVVVLGGLLVAIRSVASPRPRYKRGA
jgi:hypothetical protein